MTASATAADRSRAIAAGYDLHLTKPIDAAELTAAIARRTPGEVQAECEATLTRRKVRAPVKKWVLVIDDLRDQAELWSDVCAQAGLNAMTAGTGLDGYRRAHDVQPAPILLDIALPDIDGWEVCRRLKTDERTKTIPVVILPARDEPDGLVRGAALGCAAYLKNLCSPADLLGVIHNVLLQQEAV